MVDKQKLDKNRAAKWYEEYQEVFSEATVDLRTDAQMDEQYNAEDCVDTEKILRSSDQTPYPYAPFPDKTSQLRREIQDILNCYCAENNSDTPDFILAEFVMDALHAFDKAVRRRSEWYGGCPYKNKIGMFECDEEEKFSEVYDGSDDGWMDQYSSIIRLTHVVLPDFPPA